MGCADNRITVIFHNIKISSSIKLSSYAEYILTFNKLSYTKHTNAIIMNEHYTTVTNVTSLHYSESLLEYNRLCLLKTYLNSLQGKAQLFNL